MTDASRRDFVAQSALSALSLFAAGPRAGAFPLRTPGTPDFLDLRRPPDRIVVESANGSRALQPGGNGRWSGDDGTAVTVAERVDALRIELAAPAAAIKRVLMRWRGSLGHTRLIVGDAWERGYGDLEWRGWVPDRMMPWYVATTDGARTHAYGVRTGAGAFCGWFVDRDGITLSADVRSGGAGVQLGDRRLHVGDVVCRAGRAGESAFAAIHAFCRQMCAAPRLPVHPIYGSNDWYWAYGDNSAGSVRADAQRIVELSPSGSNRPFAVIDDGWQPEGGHNKDGAGRWDHGNEKFPDLPALVGDIRRAGARPGIWIRPLQAPVDAPTSWRLSRDHGTLDPSVPDVRQKVADDIARLRAWGFDLIKHDYSTYDILGRWGFQMGSTPTRDGWTFAAGAGRTTAEIIDDLYGTIRRAAGDGVIIGCNTVSHLSAGHFEICRIGDDTSGTEWARTRKMGVNSLAFRGAQHGAFYAADPDCIGVTTDVPWALTKQWLDLVARSGTMLFVSLASAALGAEQRDALRRALAMAAVPQPLAEPLDWQHALYPEQWRSMGRVRQYDWVGANG